MLTRFGGLTQLLGVQVPQRKIRPCFIGVMGKQFLQLIGRIYKEFRLLQNQGKVVPGIQCIGAYG
jgi:hypothetical protein